MKRTLDVGGTEKQSVPEILENEKAGSVVETPGFSGSVALRKEDKYPRSMFPRFQLIVSFFREILSTERFPREPKPDLVMDGESEVEAYRNAGRIDGIMSANYIFQTARITQVIQGCKTVVDLGCGPATQLAQVASFNPQTQFIGVELSDEMILEARAYVERLGLTNVTFVKQDMSHLTHFADHSVDGVISTLALHHLPTREHLKRTFQEVARILVPGGAVYLTDFGRLKSLSTVLFFAHKNADRQPGLFTRDYERSLRAAFLHEDFQSLTRDWMPAHVQVQSTFRVPFLVAVKSPDRPVPSRTIEALQKLAKSLSPRYKPDLNEMRIFYRLGGFGPDLFGRPKNIPEISVPRLIDGGARTDEESAPSLKHIRAMVDGARWAPSGDNVQPFTYEWDGTELTVREEAERSRAFLNVGNAAGQMALGMALANIELVAEREGWVPCMELQQQSDRVARVTFQPGSARPSLLAEAIPLRTVDRRPYRPSVLPTEYVNELSDVHSRSHGIRLRFVRTAEKMDQIARLTGGFESFLFEHRASHDYLYRWLRFSNRTARRTGDGLPVSTLGIGLSNALNLRVLSVWALSRLFSWVGLTGLAGRRARQVYRQSAGFGVFTVPKGDGADFVEAGRQWQKLWLQLTLDGWSLQPLLGNAMMGLLCREHGGEGLTASKKERFVHDDQEIRQIVGVGEGETIACVFRLGRSESPVRFRAPRRPLDRVLKVTSPQVSSPETPKEFNYETAFSRNLGLVQPEEQKRLKNSVVAIAGLGGVGGVHATTLARRGIGGFHLADFDRFEVHNFNRQAGATTQTVGQKKVDVMAEQVLAINPEADIRRFSEGVTSDNVDAFLDGVDVVVDGLDFFAPQAREVLYDAAHRRGIPLVTAGPMGMSVAWLVFAPGGMGWRDYFRFDQAKSPLDKLILFALGLTPRATQMNYIDRTHVNFQEHRGPSLSMAVQLCAGVAAGEVLKLLLGRGTVSPAPHYHQFVVYQGRLVTGTLRWGNGGWFQRAKFHIARRWIGRKSRETVH